MSTGSQEVTPKEKKPSSSNLNNRLWTAVLLDSKLGPLNWCASHQADRCGLVPKETETARRVKGRRINTCGGTAIPDTKCDNRYRRYRRCQERCVLCEAIRCFAVCVSYWMWSGRFLQRSSEKLPHWKVSTRQADFWKSAGIFCQTVSGKLRKDHFNPIDRWFY